jgi:hypothetical protein
VPVPVDVVRRGPVVWCGVVGGERPGDLHLTGHGPGRTGGFGYKVWDRRGRPCRLTTRKQRDVVRRIGCFPATTTKNEKEASIGE